METGVWAPRVAEERRLLQVEARLVEASDDVDGHFERACLLDRLGRDDDARRAYLDVLARDLGHGGALRQFAALLARRGFTTAARTVLLQAVGTNPGDAAAQASLGHLLREAGDMEAAHQAYQAALRADPLQAEAHQGMSYLLDEVDEAEAARHRSAGFAGRVLTSRPYRGIGPPIVVLRLVSGRGGNVPLRHLLDDTVFLTHTLVVDHAERNVALPPHQLVFNAIGDAERCGEALDTAQRLLERTTAPVFNPPERVRPTTREANSQRLGVLEGVVAPRLATVTRAGLQTALPPGFAYPVLLRSPGFHTGQHFIRVESAVDLAPMLATLPGERLSLIEPLDARSADGFFRKYRVMMVGGALLPLHLAISPTWKVHHFTAEMQDRPEHRAEEAAFLADMPAALGPVAMAALGRIHAALGLDYGGIDFALDARGRVLLFEANATMTVAPPVPGSVWAYRGAAVGAVIERTEAALRRAAAAASCGGTLSSGKPPEPL